MNDLIFRLYLIMKIKLLVICLLPVYCFAQSFNNVQNYKVDYAIAVKNGYEFIAWRSFSANNKKYLLLLDPQNFNTSILAAEDVRLSRFKFANVSSLFKNTAYTKAINSVRSNDVELQNAGISHAIPTEKGVNLTIDLCPSNKPLDRVVFTSLFTEFAKIEQPVPLAISVSGKWMLKHEDDLKWLKKLVAQHQLDITWINHSYNHEVNKLPLAENFLLSKGTNLDVEVLENEKLMLKNGLTPSIFFRFPGLVSSQKVVEQLMNYGLIPIGSDAWLAKGQQANNGSIVLIHANGNEEIGVKDFIQLLQQQKVNVKNKQWLLFDLRKSLE